MVCTAAAHVETITHRATVVSMFLGTEFGIKTILLSLIVFVFSLFGYPHAGQVLRIAPMLTGKRLFQ